MMGGMATQITSVSIVYSTVCSGADQINYLSSASLAFVREIHRWPVSSPLKRASNAENSSLWWRHHDTPRCFHIMISLFKHQHIIYIYIYIYIYTCVRSTPCNICWIQKRAARSVSKILGAVSIRKTVLPGMAIPMLKIRRPNGRLIFNMEIAIRR